MRATSLRRHRRDADRHFADAGGWSRRTREGGYGDALYNDDTYGTPRTISPIAALDKVPSAYSLDNFGSILYAMTSADGRLLMWDPAVGGPAVVQPADAGRGPVPLGRCFVVTNERFIMIFGSANRRHGRRR